MRAPRSGPDSLRFVRERRRADERGRRALGDLFAPVRDPRAEAAKEAERRARERARAEAERAAAERAAAELDALLRRGGPEAEAARAALAEQRRMREARLRVERRQREDGPRGFAGLTRAEARQTRGRQSLRLGWRRDADRGGHLNAAMQEVLRPPAAEARRMERREQAEIAQEGRRRSEDIFERSVLSPRRSALAMARRRGERRRQHEGVEFNPHG
jgi:hypothetical protein